jgi:hypothetical protein
MNEMPPAKLQSHLYDWMVRDCEKEIRDGFPTLRKIASGRLARFLEIMDAKSKDEQRHYCLTYLRIASYDGSTLPNKDSIWGIPTDSDRAILKGLKPQLLSPSKVEQHQVLLSLRGDLKGLISKQLLRKRLKQELPSEFGLIRWRDGSEWGHSSAVYDLEINTNIDTGGHYQLRFDHEICYKRSVGNVLFSSNYNCLFWLGTNLAYWDCITADNLDEAIQSILQAGKRFFMAVRMSREQGG